MRIVHLSDCYLPRLGGIEMQVHDLAQRQRAAGHAVEVITATPASAAPATATATGTPATPAPASAPPGTGGAAEGIRVHRVTVDLPYELPVHPRAARRIRQILSVGNYDVVHVHAGVVSPFAYAGAPVAVRAGIPTVITVHCMWGPLAPALRLLDRHWGWSRWPAVFSAVSDVAAVPIRAIAGPDVDVTVLPNGIEAAHWRVEPVDRDCDDVLLVAVMRLAPRKRPMALMRMLRQVRALVPAQVRLRAAVIGAGPERRSMERYLHRHAMTGWVHLPGRLTREQIREVYRRADIFVAPANLESFGIAALEARCAGVPVVAKSHSGIPDFVVHGQEGLLAATDADMVDAIVRLARMPELRTRMAAHNRAVSPSAGWDDVLKLTEAAYRRAATLVRPP